jgi:DNA mismatch repair ATPase MutS
VPGPFFWLGLLAHLGLIGLTRKTLQAYYAQFEGAEAGFVRFERTFETIEKNTFQHPRLKALRLGLDKAGQPVSVRLKAVGRLFSFVEVRQSGQMHGLLNLFLLWDLLWVFRIEKWRQAEGSHVRGFFEALAEWEALCALATFAFEHPQYVFPTLEDGPPYLLAEQLGHPLLPRPVLNDLQLSKPGMAFMVTGSNMSGKSTWLRAIGLNAVMAQAGLPVCASAFRMSPLNVSTSMRVKDSLERGVSYFYAEVQRLKLLLEAASEGRTLFLLDEVLMGTNTLERQMASKAILLFLLRKGSIGGVATHDLSLTEWPDTPDVHIENVHFQDLLVDGQMHFDYQLKPGVVGSTNALRVMRQAGIPI